MAEVSRRGDVEEDAVLTPELAAELQRFGLPVHAGQVFEVKITFAAAVRGEQITVRLARSAVDRDRRYRRPALPEPRDDGASSPQRATPAPFSATPYFASFETDDPQLSEKAKSIVRESSSDEDA